MNALHFEYGIGSHSRDAPHKRFISWTLDSINMQPGKGNHMFPHYLKWIRRIACCAILAAGSTALGQDDGPPTAVAGTDQSIHAGQMVYLDGSESFDDNTGSALLNYSWAFVSVPPSSNAMLDDPWAAATSFVADVPGTYVVDLVVFDDIGQASAPDELIISSFNLPPTAIAGGDTVCVIGTLAYPLFPSAWDPEGDPLTFQWTLVDKPLGSASTLSNATGNFTNRASLYCYFTPDLPGEYTLEVVADDGFGPSMPAQAVIAAIRIEEAVSSQLLMWITILNREEIAITNEGNLRAFTNLLNQAIQAIQADNLPLARMKLEMCIERTDGIALRGWPGDVTGPGRDWIIDEFWAYWLYYDLLWALDGISP